MAILGVAATIVGVVGLAAPATPARADVPNTCAAVNVTTSVGAWHDSRIDTSSDVDWYRFSVTEPRHAMVTLGGLSSNLSLAIYDASCHLIATSARGGTMFEQIYRSFARGHYFARISGVSGATGPYALQFRVLANGFVVLSSHASVDHGRATVYGDLLDNGPTPGSALDAAAIFYDARGRVVTATNCMVEVEVIAARHRAPVDCSAFVPPSYDHYRLFVDRSGGGGDVTPDLTLTHNPTSVLPDGTRVYSGSLRNGNSVRLTDAEVAVMERDNRGRVIMIAADYLRGVAAHSSINWQLSADPVSGIRQVSFYADGRRYGDA